MKSRQMRWLLLLGFAGLLGVSSAEAGVNLGGRAGAFLRVGLGARNIAMGDCGVAPTGEGIAAYYNPSALAREDYRAATFQYRSLSLDRSLMYLGTAASVPPSAGVGLGIIRASVKNIDARDSNGRRFDLLSWSDNVVLGTFALQPHDILALGVSLKWFFSEAPDILEGGKTLRAYGMGVDLGASIHLTDGFKLGVQLRDLNSKFGWDTDEVWGDSRGPQDDHLPFAVRLGAAYDLTMDLLLVSDLLIYPEAAQGEEFVIPHLGVEWRYQANLKQMVAARAGWNGRAPTFGFGLTTPIGRVKTALDYAFQMEQISPGGSHIVSWTFTL